MFDPYHKWLGILSKDQPPNHYRLLSLELFESDLDVIEGAADRAMGFIRNYQSGEHAALAAKLLNEIATARLCLLRPASKSEYDTKLGKQLAVSETAKDESPAFAMDSEVAELMKAPKLVTKSKRKKAKSSQGLLIGGGIAGAVCVLLIAIFASRGGKPVPIAEPSARDIVQSNPHEVAQSKPIVTKPIESSSTTEPARTPTAVAGFESAPAVEPAGPPVDLIRAVDLTRDTVHGDWKKQGTFLIGGSVGPRDDGPTGRLYLPATLPDDYQLKLTAKRIAGKDTLLVGFVMAGREGLAVFDGRNSEFSGLYLDGVPPHANCTTRLGAVFQNDQLSTIVITVHPGHFHAAIDGTTIINWHGDPERLWSAQHGVINRESPFLITAQARYQIESALMIPIKPEPQPARASRLGSWIDLMSLIDPERDATRGLWALNKNVLHSPESLSGLSLPAPVPEEYSLGGTLELPVGGRSDATFGVGLIAGKTNCSIVAINLACAGLERIDGFRWDSNETRVPSARLVPGKPIPFMFTVTNVKTSARKRIRMDFDGRTLIDWIGDPRRLSTQDDWVIADGRKLFVESSTHFKMRDLKLGPPTDPPNLPAHPAIETGRPLDLLGLVDPKRDALEGTWTKEGTALRVMGDARTARLVVPCDVPAEYKLTMRVTRETGGQVDNEGLVLSVPTDGVVAQAVFDGNSSTISGLHIDRLGSADRLNVSSHRGQVFPLGTPQDVVVYVRKTGMKVVIAGKTIIDWSGSMSRMWSPPEWGSPSTRIAIGSWLTRFRIDKLDIEPLESTSFAPVADLGSDGNLLSVVDPVRDSRRGNWKLGISGLVSTWVRATRIQFPVSVPERYEFTATVERKTGIDALFVGFVVGGQPATVIFDGNGGSQSGLLQLDGVSFNDAPNPTRRAHKTALFPVGQPCRICCRVLPDTVIVDCGDQEVIRWHGDARRITQTVQYQPSNYCEEDGKKLWFGAWDTEFVIHDAKLRPLSDDEATRMTRGFTGVFPTDLQADLPFKKADRGSETSKSTDAENLVILKARYGTDTQFVDITDRLAASVQAGYLLVAVDDSLGVNEAGDSIRPTAAASKGQPKVLYLRYRLNGVEKADIVEQNQVVQIDARPAPSAKPSKAFKLLEARRGTGVFQESTWTDVTSALRSAVKKDALSINDDELDKLIDGTGSSSKAKGSQALFVRYQYDGQDRVVLIPDGTPILLGDAPLRPGLILQAFEGIELKSARLVEISPNIHRDFGLGSPGPGISNDHFSVRWLGSLNIAKAGKYTFIARFDDACRVWIDGDLLVDIWSGGDHEQAVEVTLSKKMHSIKVDYAEHISGGKMILSWESDSILRQIIPASVFYHDPKFAKQLGLK